MALLEQFTNFASTTIVNAINAGDTALVLTDPSRFPSLSGSQYFYAVLSDSINPLVPPTKREIVKVTARSGANITVVRGQDGTSAQTWASLSYFELRLVAQTFTDLHDQIIVDAQATQYSLSSPTDITLTYDNDNNGTGSFLVKKAASTKLQVTNAGELLANPSYANMKQWGADNTGVSDCLAAVNAAIAAGYTKLYFPKGRYNFSSGTGIVTTNQNLMIYGDGTNNSVLFISGAAGFDLINFTGQYTEFYSHCLVVKDIGLETTVASGAAQGTAIKATMNASASVNKAPYTSVYLDNVSAGNGVYNSCWAYGVRMDTCQFAKILNCFFDGFMPTGPGAGTRAGVGIDIYSRLVLNNNVKATDINIENTTVFQATTGIQVNNYPDSNYNYCEGIHIDHCTVLNCTTGIRIGTTTFLSASLLPGWYINGTHITATTIGVDVQTVAQLFMAENLIYATGGTNFTGINFVVDATAGGYAQSIIRNNAIIVPPAYAGNIYGVNVTAADATPANANLSIAGNLFSSNTAFTACVNAAANVQGVLVEPNNRYVAQPFVSVTDSGSNNIMKGFNDYVGIMKSPTFPLDIKTNSGIAAGIRLENGDAATNNIGIRFRGANAAVDQWVVGNAVGSNDASRNFDFYDLVAATNRFRIDANGYVGIGTGVSALSYNLTVNNGSADSVVRVQSGSGYAGLSLHASGTNATYMFFSNATSAERGRIAVDNNGGFTFYTGAAVTQFLRAGSGGLFLENLGSIYWKDSGGTDRLILQFYSDNAFYIQNPYTNGNIYIRPTGGGSVIIRKPDNSVDFLGVTANGTVYGNALHNNAAANPVGSTFQYIASGTYTPTLTNTTNISASTAYAFQWMRVGNVLHVSGQVDIDATAAGACLLKITLPAEVVNANFTSVREASGVASMNNSGVANECGAIVAENATQRVNLAWNAVSLTNNNWTLNFQCLIK